MMRSVPTTFYRDNILCVAAWRDIFFEIWFAAGTGRHFRTLRHHLMSFAHSQPDQKVAVFSVVQLPSLTNVDSEIREEAMTRAKEIKPHNKASVLVIESKGFVASLIRGIVTGMAHLDRAGGPSKIFDTVGSAAAWIAPQMEPHDGRRLAGAAVLEIYESVKNNSTNVGVLRP
jgi:hypothetical protein